MDQQINPSAPRSQAPLLSIPVAIIIAGAIIAGAIIWTLRPAPVAPVQKAADVVINLKPVSSSDHILGNPQAPIIIVEYSDLSCPFCKTFNPTMTDVLNTYGPAGTVAWVYRNFPLDKPDASGNVLHVNAGHEAQAIECTSLLGGNDAFWKFEKRLYDITPSVTGQTPKGLDQSQLPEIAKYAGVADTKAFNDCLSSGKMQSVVEADYTSGINAGVSGTPTSFFVLAKPASAAVDTFISSTISKYGLIPSLFYISTNRKIIALSGAMPKEVITGLITAIQGK